MKNVLIIQNIVYPLRHSFFEKLNNHKDIKLNLFFLSKTASNRKWDINKSDINYPFKIIKNFRLKLFSGKFDLILNPFIIFDYLFSKHEYLISIGWANPSNYLLCFMSKLRGIPYFLWVESTLNEPSLQRTLMSPLIKMLIKNSEKCIVPGTASRLYIESFKQSPNIITIRNSLNKETNKNLKKKTNKLPVLLYVGRFSSEKNLLFLLNAIKNIEKNKRFELWLIGYGPQKKEILDYIKDNKIKSVTRVEYSDRDKINKIYNNADLFILASKNEPWGFVVNEAMSAGLPVVISENVGCSADLVKDDVNGYTFDQTNIADLEEKLIKLIDNPEKRFKMGIQSLKRISQYTIQDMVSEFYENI